MNNKIDYKDFIDSKDIRKYLSDIKYELSPLATSWLIYHTAYQDYETKHEAWQQLIETTEDFSIKKRLNTCYQKSFHNFLKKYMEIEERIKDRFYVKENGWYYTFTFYCKCGEKWDYEGIYDDYQKALEKITMEDSYYEPTEINFYICCKRKINEPDNYILGIFNEDFKLLSVAIENDTSAEEFNLTEKEQDIYFHVFSGLWFDIPTPFKKGDIIYNPKRKRGYLTGPMVLKYLNTEGLSKKVINNVKKYGDEIDMCANCYFVLDNGEIYEESTDNYIDFEYYPLDKLEENKKTILAFSQYLKGEIDLCLLVQSYTYLLTKNKAEALKPRDYTKEALKLVGIEDIA